MSDNVIAFPKKEEAEPHAAGECICLTCKHEWVGVAAVGVIDLECPSCHTHKGVWKFAHHPGPDVEHYECKCGNRLFIITRDYHFCPNCGVTNLY